MISGKGIGPQGSSLLHKLGKRQAWEMSEAEIHLLVAKEQQRRTIARALGRAQRAMEETAWSQPRDDDGAYVPKKVGRPRTKSRVKSTTTKKQPERLEDFGLQPDLIAKLRAGGKPDFQLILELQGAGII